MSPSISSCRALNNKLSPKINSIANINKLRWGFMIFQELVIISLFENSI